MAARRFVAVAAALSFPAFAAAQCFQENGTLVPGDLFLPCNNVAGTSSMCCALNRTVNPGSQLLDTTKPDLWPRDICLANGLCKNIYVDATGTVQYNYSRDFCSFPDWEGCLKGVCGDSEGIINPCGGSDGTVRWCCGHNVSACCSDWDNHPDAVEIPLVLGQGTASNVSSDNASGSGSPNHPLSEGAKTGIGVGLGLGFLLLVGGAVNLWRYQIRKKRRRGVVELADNLPSVFEDKMGLRASARPELPGVAEPAELDAHRYHQLEAQECVSPLPQGPGRAPEVGKEFF